MTKKKVSALPYDRRGSGRTTRSLRSALQQAAEGNLVFFYCHASQMFPVVLKMLDEPHMSDMQMLVRRVTPRGIFMKSGGEVSLVVARSNRDEHEESLMGSSHSVRRVYDHFVYETWLSNDLARHRREQEDRKVEA